MYFCGVSLSRRISVLLRNNEQNMRASAIPLARLTVWTLIGVAGVRRYVNQAADSLRFEIPNNHSSRQKRWRPNMLCTWLL